MYVCVCFGLSLRVHSGPADHAVRPNPRAGGCNRRSRGLPAVTLPILCTLAAIYVLRFERRFGLPKVLRQSCSPDPCTSPAITFRISVFAHFVYTCRMPFLFIISMSWVSRWVCGKCTQNGQSVAGRGVRPECRDHGPGARIPCPKDRLRRRLSPRASVTVCNCRLSPRTYHTGPQPPAVDLPGPRCGLGVNTSRAQGREVAHCGTRNSSQVLWTRPGARGRRPPGAVNRSCSPRAHVAPAGANLEHGSGNRIGHRGVAPMCRRTARRPRTAPLLPRASRGSSMHLCRDVHHPVILGSDVPGYRTNPARNRKAGGDDCRATGRNG